MAPERFESKQNELGKALDRIVDRLERTAPISRTSHAGGRSRVTVLESNAHV